MNNGIGPNAFPVKEEIVKDVRKDTRYPISTGMKIIFYMLSFLFFPGIVFGAVFYSKDDPEYRRVGKKCLFIALIPFFFYLFIFIGILFMGQMDVFSDRIKDVPY